MSTTITEHKERKVQLLVEDLRLWILSQPHLNSRTGDDFLRAFLQGCFYNLNETKKRIELYYTHRNAMTSVFENRKINRRLLDICRMGVIIDLLVKINDKGARLHLLKFADLEPNAYKFSEIMKVSFMMTEIQMIESEYPGPCRLVHVVDLKGVKLRHCLHFHFRWIKKVTELVKNGLPLQIDEIHIINASNYFAWLLCIVCASMSKEFKEKYFFHSSMESLYRLIPKEFLPVEYGGRNGCVRRSIEKQINKLLKYEAYFAEDSLYGINESLRRKV